jgi:hypothetical protein
MELRKTGLAGGGWSGLNWLKTDQWWAVVNAAMQLPVVAPRSQLLN